MLGGEGFESAVLEACQPASVPMKIFACVFGEWPDAVVGQAFVYRETVNWPLCRQTRPYDVLIHNWPCLSS